MHINSNIIKSCLEELKQGNDLVLSFDKPYFNMSVSLPWFFYVVIFLVKYFNLYKVKHIFFESVNYKEPHMYSSVLFLQMFYTMYDSISAGTQKEIKKINQFKYKLPSSLRLSI